MFKKRDRNFFGMFSVRAMLVYGTSLQIQNWLLVYVFPVFSYTCHNDIFLTMCQICAILIHMFIRLFNVLLII